jgi:septum formation protein
MEQNNLVLASGSPRRRAFLESLGLRFEAVGAEVDEAPREREQPAEYVIRIASEKARAVAGARPGALILAADTTVVLDGAPLGKPADAADARRMLRGLSGREHAVLTAVVLAGAAADQRVVSTAVRFRELTETEISWYVATGEPMDKAGAYAIQGIGGCLVREIRGSHSNVVGLPLAETLEMLGAAGFKLPWEG